MRDERVTVNPLVILKTSAHARMDGPAPPPARPPSPTRTPTQKKEEKKKHAGAEHLINIHEYQ